MYKKQLQLRRNRLFIVTWHDLINSNSSSVIKTVCILAIYETLMIYRHFAVSLFSFYVSTRIHLIKVEDYKRNCILT